MLKTFFDKIRVMDKNVLTAFGVGGLFLLLALIQLLIFVCSPFGRSWDHVLLMLVDLVIAAVSGMIGFQWETGKTENKKRPVTAAHPAQSSQKARPAQSSQKTRPAQPSPVEPSLNTLETQSFPLSPDTSESFNHLDDFDDFDTLYDPDSLNDLNDLNDLIINLSSCCGHFSALAF